MKELDWEKYRIKNNEPSNSGLDWDKYKVVEPESQEHEQQATDPIAGNIYNNGNLGALMAGVAGIKHTFDKPIHGLAQFIGLSDWAKNASKHSEDQFNKAAEAHPFLANAGKYGYELARDIPLMAMGGAGAAGALPSSLKGSMFGNLLQSILGGAFTGGTIGGANYVNEDESRLENALKGAAVGGIGSAAGHVASGTLKAGKNIFKAYPLSGAKSLADKIAITQRNAVKAESNKLFGGLINAAEGKGAKVSITSPKTEFKLAYKNMKPSERAPLKNLYEKNDYSFKDAHELYKALGEAANRLKPNASKTGVGAGRDAILKLQKRVAAQMENSLVNVGLPEQVGKLNMANMHYMENVVPHNNKIIQQYLSKKMRPHKFLEKAAGNEVFQTELGSRYPEIEVREALPKYLKYGAAGALGLGGGKLLWGGK